MFRINYAHPARVFFKAAKKTIIQQNLFIELIVD